MYIYLITYNKFDLLILFFKLCIYFSNIFLRLYKSFTKLTTNPSRGVIDGELVWMFLKLSLPDRQEIARKIGTRVNEILEDLFDIECLTANF